MRIDLASAERALRFPSFLRRAVFDGALFRIGNAASFLEPLEATAIGVILLQLRLASYWLADGFPGAGGEAKWDARVLQALNDTVASAVRAISLFVGWHYAMGSAYDTPFWRHARETYRQAREQMDGSSVAQSFEQCVEAGERFTVRDLPRIRDLKAMADVSGPGMGPGDGFGGFGETSFAQIGHGMGYYARQ